MTAQKTGIRACITNISLPKELAAFEAMLEKNTSYRDKLPASDRDRLLTDLDTLLSWTPAWKDDFGWSALKDMDAGDVLLLYHGAASIGRSRALRRQYDDGQRSDPALLSALELAAQRAARYAGTIFGCARVSGPTEWQRESDEGGYHFGARHFAPLDAVSIFDQPLRAEHFKDLVEINRFSALTTFRPAVFEQLKQRLAEDNQLDLPAFFRDAVMA